MTQSTASAPKALTPASPVGHHAAHGFAWFLSQALSIKVVSLCGQVALSYLLADTDFGYVSLAYLVGTFATLLQQAGTRDVLIQRGHDFARLANPAFWMAAALGLLSTIVMLGAAPLAAWFFKDQRLVGLIAVLSTQNVINGLTVVSEAKLQLDLRFKMQAYLGFLHAISVTILSVSFASLDHFFGVPVGPYSFILPWPIASFLRLVLLWRAAPPPLRPHPEIGLWRAMLAHSGVLLAASFFWTLCGQGDYLILGHMYDKDVVGRYFWAYNLSLQSLQLLSLNLASVLFPSLARLQAEPQRLLAGFLRAIGALMVVGVPACLLQAVLADPAIRLIFHARWYPAIPLVQILSVAFVFALVSFSSINALKAQGRFGDYLAFAAGAAILLLAFVYVGAKHAAAFGAAVGVAVQSMIAYPIVAYMAVRPLGGGVRDLYKLFAIPIAVGVVTIGGSWALASALPAIPGRSYVGAAIVCILGLSTYTLLIRIAAPTQWNELSQRLAALLGRTTAATP